MRYFSHCVYPFTALSRATVWLACLLVLVFNNAAGSDTLVELEGESIDSGSPRMRVLLDLGAQEHGVTVEQYKQQLAEEQSDQRIVDKVMPEFRLAIEQDNTVRFKNALEELDQVDVSRLVPSLFEEVINSANPDYLQLVLETGIGCRFDKIAGQRGIRAAVMHEDDRYLRTLLGHVCKSHERLTYQTLSALIARSNRPERMLLMPAGAATQSELNKAFGAILRLKETKYIQDFVELGADVNYQVENQSALLVSIDQRQSRLATWLIGQGAYASISHAPARSALVAAFETRQQSIYQLLIAMAIDNSVTGRHRYLLAAKVMSIRNQATRLVALKQLVTHDIYKFDPILFAKDWFFQAVEEEDLALLNYFVELGFVLPHRSERKKLREIVDQWQALPTTEKLIKRLEEQGILDSKPDIGMIKDCNLGESISDANPDLFTNKSLLNGPMSGSNGNADKACLITIVNCINHGEGADDCFESVPICAATLDRPGLFCCSSENKDSYFTHRCSGQPVWDTFEAIFD